MANRTDLLTDEIVDAPLTSKLKEDLGTAGKWARLTAILSFISTAFFLLFSFRTGNFVGTLVWAAAWITINIYLLNFGNKTKHGIQNIDQPELEEGLNSLGLYFKTLVIVTIIAVSLCIIAIIYYVSVTRSYNLENF